MGSPTDDLDRFLRTEGLRILRESGALRAAAPPPLAEEDTADFRAMNLESMGAVELETLLDRLEDLLDVLEDREPGDPDSGEYEIWDSRLSETEALLDRVHARLGCP